MNKENLQRELKEVLQIMDDVLQDTENPVVCPRHHLHLEANVAFRKLEKYSEELADRIQKNSKAA